MHSLKYKDAGVIMFILQKASFSFALSLIEWLKIKNGERKWQVLKEGSDTNTYHIDCLQIRRSSLKPSNFSTCEIGKNRFKKPSLQKADPRFITEMDGLCGIVNSSEIQ